MADWYVYQHDGDPLGPWSTDTVANAILAGKLAPDVWVAAPGGPRWLRGLDVPVIARLVEGLPTKPTRRESGLRLIPGGFATENGMPVFGSTMMIVKDDELQQDDDDADARAPLSAPVTARSPLSANETLKMYVPLCALEAALARLATDEAPPTDPSLPPSTTTPTPEAAVSAENDPVEVPSTDRRRRKNG